jgi:hypothetical protein
MQPIKISCPLCERLVNRVEVIRDYHRRGLNVTLWTHDHGLRCFIADDLLVDLDTEGDPSIPFEFIPINGAEVTSD